MWRDCKFLLAILTLASSFVLVGCQNKDFVPVTGVVKLDGKPVEGASVIFHKLDGKGETAVGGTDAEGNFALQTEEQPGAWVGKYEVAIRKVKTEGFPQTVDGLSGLVTDETNITEIWGVPKRYGDFRTSGMKIEVTPEIAPLEFDLKSNKE